jgi:(1->4)-alpha-D-glucan 1-alpha-D-glucosylmutase
VHTSWINPNAEYDKAVREFVAAILDRYANAGFIDDLVALQRRISHVGLFNSLSQTLLKLTCPGVPDTYQGTEVWGFSLVDPDNRRPVDYELRAAMLAELQSESAKRGDRLPAFARELVDHRVDGRVKLYATYKALHCRREYPGLFSLGEYIALDSQGSHADSLFAYCRRYNGAAAVVVVPRLLNRLIGDRQAVPLGETIWEDTHIVLPPELEALHWRNEFTGERYQGQLKAGQVLAHFPIALLLAERR